MLTPLLVHVVDDLGDGVLARACLAGNQHPGVARGHQPERAKHFFQSFARADQSAGWCAVWKMADEFGFPTSVHLDDSDSAPVFFHNLWARRDALLDPHKNTSA
jgi:hypothetical protein